MTTQAYDAIIIGAGQAGGPLASALAKAGKKTALIEEKYVGGTCINTGCTPTKTMVASAEVAEMARRAADYGVNTAPVSVDMSAVRRRKEAVVERFRTSSRGAIESGGAELIEGRAHFLSPTQVEIQLNAGNSRQISAPLVLINSGARPRIPNLPGLDRVPYLDSTRIMELEEVPDHLLVLGGGYVGLEFAQMFRRFGSQVTIVQNSGQLLGNEDADIAEAVRKILEEDGIQVRLDTSAERAESAPDGTVQLTVRANDGGEEIVSGSHLLVAVGRTPNTGPLDLPAAGVAVDALGFIQVDDRLQTSAPGIYALGDVKGGPAFTHVSYDDFRIVRANLLEGGSASTKGRLVPYTEIGRASCRERVY
jgi:pyruvate/2-oxoglutarate dehydrogenase complex dihydrolipoamide dehydrogenase (E3) component